MKTANPDLSYEDKLANAALGLTGEAGEVADIVKKALFQGHDIDIASIFDELGDVMWYIAKFCDTLGFTIDDIQEANIAKLKARYGEKFSSEASKNRGD